ncbi:dynactin complex subunit, dynamitin Jnm1 [Schizosaccharomyces osmophilus]|uniref:Dynactin complex subunit, dynamitin Jnm1 n=1 Tax=Schizosaccharomyces osmophilus TaxID=2545709 RepID=A0AAE9WH21_9SCHI|nr:dynactin complex subunit, dynamitin Jnm1 [Schizosaccharomyces osmophilus]WBW74796.1 dynactin complex subunit, dynamitin Jnm1 [Schizosaccharomyces osmophilus]
MHHTSEFTEPSDASETNRNVCDDYQSSELKGIIQTEYSVEECMQAIQNARKPKPMTVHKNDDRSSSTYEAFHVPDESYYIRLTRIRRELQDLWDEAGSTREKQEVDSLSNFLDKLWMKRMSSVQKSYSADPASNTDPNSSLGTCELCRQPLVDFLPKKERSQSVEAAIPLKMGDLESRISTLEGFVGDAEEPLSMTIESCLQKLQAFEKDPLLYENKISTWDKIQKRLPKAGNNDHKHDGDEGNPSSLSNLAPTGLLDEKEYNLVSELLFVHLQDAEKYQTLVPALLKRLKSLHCLHLETAETMNRWKNLESLLGSTTHSLNQWTQLLKHLETSSFPEQSMNEIQTISKRISDLEEFCK